MSTYRSFSRLVACCIVGASCLVSHVLAQDVPQGELIKFTFDQSKIFPGTTRDVTVYVPKQYDGKTPACVHVNQDGVQFKAPEVFDRLIAAKEIPVLIGVFVTPGKVPPPNKDALPRFNRSYEYDGLGDAYARFLLEELLPAVEAKKTADGREIKLSKNGNDRSIGGTSSGAIAAFTVAWERPNEFRRVFSGIGTYVGLRGGNDYATLIRKYEPKPLRIYLQDGNKDLNIYGGDWWMANQEMERALTFAGYEVAHEWGDGGHSGDHATKLFPDAMRWLWKDHPNGPAVGKGSPQLQEILIPGEEWQLVADGYKFTEGPTANAQGEVFFNDIPNSKTYKIGLDGKVSEFLADSKKANGQAVAKDGTILAVSGEESILAINNEGKVITKIDGIKGNDITVLSNNDAYITAPSSDPKVPSKIWYISGESGEKRVVDEGGIKFTNGITVSPDQSLLYVADSRSHWVYSYQIQENGDLKFKQKYFHLHQHDADDGGADGMRVDRAGRLYVATRLGIQVCDQPGRVNCIIPTPNGRCSNLTFGGPYFDVIYATCGDKVFMRKVKTQGIDPSAAPLTPKTPRL